MFWQLLTKYLFCILAEKRSVSNMPLALEFLSSKYFDLHLQFNTLVTNTIHSCAFGLSAFAKVVMS